MRLEHQNRQQRLRAPRKAGEISERERRTRRPHKSACGGNASQIRSQLSRELKCYFNVYGTVHVAVEKSTTTALSKGFGANVETRSPVHVLTSAISNES